MCEFICPVLITVNGNHVAGTLQLLWKCSFYGYIIDPHVSCFAIIFILLHLFSWHWKNQNTKLIKNCITPSSAEIEKNTHFLK